MHSYYQTQTQAKVLSAYLSCLLAKGDNNMMKQDRLLAYGDRLFLASKAHWEAKSK